MTVDDGYEGGETKTKVRRMVKHESAKVREREGGEGIGGDGIGGEGIGGDGIGGEGIGG